MNAARCENKEGESIEWASCPFAGCGGDDSGVAEIMLKMGFSVSGRSSTSRTGSNDSLGMVGPRRSRKLEGALDDPVISEAGVARSDPSEDILANMLVLVSGRGNGVAG